MERRKFLLTAAASGAIAAAGCLGEDNELINGDGPPTYDLPAYSGWPAAETDDGVVFVHLRLSTVPALRRLVEDGRLPADGPLFGLPVGGIDAVPNAVETVTDYPFAANLRRAINETVTGGLDGDSTNDSLVELIDDTANGSSTTEGSTATDSDSGAGVLGIDVTAITLVGDVLLFHGSYDVPVVTQRYTDEFQRVDEQRGLEIFEHQNSTEAFAVGSELLVVPTGVTRATPPETILARSLSRYINTVDRVVDTEDGRWLFATTGQPALSVGVWGADDSIGRLGSEIGELPVDGTDPVFGRLDGLLAAVVPTIAESSTITDVEARFAGVYPDTPPTEDELRSTLGGTADSETVFVSEPRAHVSASIEDL